MKLQITTRHCELTPELRGFAEERVLKLKRYFDHILDANLILATEKHRQLAELTLHLNGSDMIGAAESADMRTSIDEAADHIEAQLKKHKDRMSRKKGRRHLGEAMSSEAPGPGGVDIEED